jgi:hypothetical protein
MTAAVYATGCQFEAFEIDLATSGQEVKRQFNCQPLRTQKPELKNRSGRQW